MNIKKFAAAALSLVIAASAIPFSASAAASPEVTEIDGERTAFYSTFGRITYNDKTYTAYKSFGDAMKAIGKDGGRIVMTGTAELTDFADIKGRNPITVVGIGTNSYGNVLDFSGNGDIELEGDLSLGYLNIKTDADAYILTNGHALEGFDEFDTYHVAKYDKETTTTRMTYVDPPSVGFGKVSGDSYSSLCAGTYKTIAAGSVEGKEVSGNTTFILGQGKMEKAVAGNVGNGTMNGDATLRIDYGEIGELYAGSLGGTVNGNVKVVINNGAIGDITIGAGTGAVINGNITMAIFGGRLDGKIKTGAGKITGKKTVILGKGVDINIDKSAVDYIIRIDGGICDPVYDGSVLKGFAVSDKYGIPAKKITVNGSEMKSDNAIYNFSNGEVNISVKTDIEIKLNKSANYVSGYEDGTFGPQKNMTKAEAVVLLSRLIIDENIIKGNVTSTYKDVEAGSWYESYIGFFEKVGFLDEITEDYGTKICPQKNITRGEFTQLIYMVGSMGDTPVASKLASFSDISNSKYGAAISYAVASGIILGYEDGTFRPNANITRAEVVTMVNRLLGREPSGKAGDKNFSDISGHWANSQILAACGKENVSWTKKDEKAEEKYVLSGTSAEEYIKGLYGQSKTLSGNAIRDGVELISEKIKKDVVETKNTADIMDLSEKRIIYISELHGDDDKNDGSSPEKAFKTIAGLKKAKFLKNAAVLFERGGVYRGQLAPTEGFIYGSYGEGAKPVLMQSRRNFADPKLWVETGIKNVWKCTQQLANVGIIGFDHDLFDYSDDSYKEKYGILMNLGILGFQGVTDLNTDLQFYSDLGAGSSTTALGDLYLYSDKGNPGSRFKSIEMGEKFDIVDGSPKNVIIDNISFKFTGAHAIGLSSSTNVTVQNCVFSWLGGSVLSKDFHGTGRPVNYGNAIETASCDGYHVNNCWFYQIYDTAVTHQCSTGDTTNVQKDVSYIGNLMEYCHWGVEYYNNPGGLSSGHYRSTDGVYCAYNVCRLGGYGWGSIVRARTSEARLYCGTAMGENKNQLTEYNIYDRCAGYLLIMDNSCKEVQDKNIYIQTEGRKLGTLRGTACIMDADAANNIRKYWKDENAVVILVDPKKEPVIIDVPAGAPSLDI